MIVAVERFVVAEKESLPYVELPEHDVGILHCQLHLAFVLAEFVVGMFLFSHVADDENVIFDSSGSVDHGMSVAFDLQDALLRSSVEAGVFHRVEMVSEGRMGIYSFRHAFFYFDGQVRIVLDVDPREVEIFFVEPEDPVIGIVQEQKPPVRSVNLDAYGQRVQNGFGLPVQVFILVPQRHAFGDVFDFQYDAFHRSVAGDNRTGRHVDPYPRLNPLFDALHGFFPECRFDEFPGVRILHPVFVFVARLADLEKAGAVVEFGRQHMGGVFPGHPVIGRDVDEAAGGVVHDQRILFEQLLAAVFIGQFPRNVFLRADDNRNFSVGRVFLRHGVYVDPDLFAVDVGDRQSRFGPVGFPAGYFPEQFGYPVAVLRVDPGEELVVSQAVSDHLVIVFGRNNPFFHVETPGSEPSDRHGQRKFVPDHAFGFQLFFDGRGRVAHIRDDMVFAERGDSRFDVFAVHFVFESPGFSGRQHPVENFVELHELVVQQGGFVVDVIHDIAAYVRLYAVFLDGYGRRMVNFDEILVSVVQKSRQRQRSENGPV